MESTAGVVTPRLEADFRGRVLANSRCVFAPGAVLRFGAELEARGERLDSLEAVHEELSVFAARGRREGLDGFVTACYAPRFLEDLEGVCCLVRRTLDGLLRLEAGAGHAAAVLGTVRPTRWWFPFGGERFFLTVFAPIYPSSSSRTTFGAPACFLFFQPDHSFDRRVLDPATWEAHRREIRANHRRHGQPYDPDLVQFVAPLRAGQVVRWWEPAPPAHRHVEPASRGEAGAELRLLVHVYDALRARAPDPSRASPFRIPEELLHDLRRSLVRDDLLPPDLEDPLGEVARRAWRLYSRSRRARATR